MKLQEWRDRQRKTVELPSGLTVTMRKVSLVDLAARGKIPTPLTGMVNGVINGGPVSVMTVEDFEQYGQVVDLVVLAAVIEPQVVEAGQGDDEHIGLDEFPLEDKVVIFNMIHEGAEQLAPFRGKPAGDVDAAPIGENLQGAPEPDSGGA